MIVTKKLKLSLIKALYVYVCDSRGKNIFLSCIQLTCSKHLIVVWKLGVDFVSTFFAFFLSLLDEKIVFSFVLVLFVTFQRF